MYATQEVFSLFEVILTWYRDLHLLKVGGNPHYILHRDYISTSSDAFERGNILPLETVQKAISEARLSLERSTSIQICFENLFLKLDLLK